MPASSSKSSRAPLGTSSPPAPRPPPTPPRPACPPPAATRANPWIRDNASPIAPGGILAGPAPCEPGMDASALRETPGPWLQAQPRLGQDS